MLLYTVITIFSLFLWHHSTINRLFHCTKNISQKYKFISQLYSTLFFFTNNFASGGRKNTFEDCTKASNPNHLTLFETLCSCIKIPVSEPMRTIQLPLFKALMMHQLSIQSKREQEPIWLLFWKQVFCFQNSKTCFHTIAVRLAKCFETQNN
jgi:hypothetical protein